MEPGWAELLRIEFDKAYFRSLVNYLEAERRRGKTIFPPKHLVFNAFALCPLAGVRVVILGQDPYHGPGQAMGLSFSVPRGVRIPSSLRNMYKELETDIAGFRMPRHGDLTNWASQGVLLLNTGLTVRASEANSHKGRGWQTFTDSVISLINKQCSNVVFLLWGKHAQSKASKIGSRHLVLQCAHPSGLSAHRGFFGCKHFSKCNEYLRQHGKEPIHWQV